MRSSLFRELLLLKVKEVKKKVYKAFVVFSMTTLVFNMSVVGVFFVANDVDATPTSTSGSIWTTTESCGLEKQDVNKFGLGEHVYINGRNFSAGDYLWEIEGQPGDASSDPKQVVASGTKTVDSSGAFCFDAYTVANDDRGTYSIKFDTKGDNYRVDTCGDNIKDLQEECDLGSSNGTPGATCTSLCEDTTGFCNKGDLQILDNKLDGINIGDITSEEGRNLIGWSNNQADLPFDDSNYGGGSDDKSFRLLMGPGDGCEAGDIGASFKLNAGTDYANQLIIEHLDGSQTDSFDVYVNDEKIGHYTHVSAGENWVTSTFNFPPATGEITVEIKATEPTAEWCKTYGQVAFSNVSIKGYTCEKEEVCSFTSPNWNKLDSVNIGDLSSEGYHLINGWSEADIPGDYGGCQNGISCSYRQVVESPCTDKQKSATMVLHAEKNFISELKVKHLDGISLNDSFEIWNGETKIAEWSDATKEANEIWKETEFNVAEHNLTGDIILTFKAIDPVWDQCNTYGQVSIDWVEIYGCGTPWEPKIECGNGVVESGEECDASAQNGQPNSTCTIQCKKTDPYCEQGEVNVLEKDLDYLNIGDIESESGYGLTGWSNDWVNGGWGGNYGGGSDDKSFRLLMGSGDGCADNNTSASFILNAGVDYANQLTLNHLDGLQADSFDVYVNGNKVGFYSDVIRDSEAWVTSTFNFPPATGKINVELKLTDPAEQWCTDWGQVGFSWAKINGYTCYQDSCSENSADWKILDNVDIGGNASEIYHPISGWSNANISGNYGGCQNGVSCTYRQIIENPCTSDQKPASVVLHAGTNTVSKLKVRHLDGISLADSFEIWVGNQKIAEWKDATEAVTENWIDTTFDVSQYSLSGDITLTFVATDNIWSQCNAYGQVSIDWVQVNGCGAVWEPKMECGNGVVESGEECDTGAQNGQPNSACTIQCKKTDPYCEQGKVTIDEMYLDSVNIGDAASETGHNISVGAEGTGWSNAWLSPDGWGGVYGGGSSDGSFRLLMGRGDDCSEGYEDASFILDTGTNYANQITLEHLDGSVNDSFDIYINNSKVGHYEADASTNENWGSLTFYFPPFMGLITVKLVTTNPDVSWCGEWGQVAFSNAGIKGYTCQGTEIVPRCGDGIKNQESEQCDGTEGVTTGSLCNTQCQLYQNTNGGGPANISGGSSFYGSSIIERTVSTSQKILVKGEEGAPILKITKAILSKLDFVSPGQKDIEYIVTVTNEGNMTAFGVALKDTLPEGVKFTDGSANPRSWDLGDIEAGKSKAVTYKVNVDAGVKSMLYKNIAEATATNIDKPVQSSVDLDVRAINVLAETGFDIVEFVGLFSAFLSLVGLSLFLRRKVVINEN